MVNETITHSLHKPLELLVNIHYTTIMNQGDNNITKPDIISLEQLEQEEKPEKPFLSPQMEGESSVSGSMPDPESDDDVLKNAHDMGLQRGETFNSQPQELDIAKDVDSNEKHSQTH